MKVGHSRMNKIDHMVLAPKTNFYKGIPDKAPKASKKMIDWPDDALYIFSNLNNNTNNKNSISSS